MSRQRFIYPEIFTSQQFIALSHSARLLWIGLFTCADDHGRGRASPAALAATVFPGEHHPDKSIERWLCEVTGQGLVELYAVAGARYYAIPTWNSYQRPRHVGKSRIPPPDAGSMPAHCRRDAGATPAEGAQDAGQKSAVEKSGVMMKKRTNDGAWDDPGTREAAE